MGVLHILGGLLLFLASKVEHNGPFYWVILLYSLAYMPTIALSNSVAFRQMTDPGKQFPMVRVFGTVGWVVAGFMIALLGIEKSPATFYMAAIVSGALGFYSFALPSTPPQGKTRSSAKAILGIDALMLFRERPYTIFFISAIFVCIPLSFYFGFANLFLNQSGMQNAAGKMVMGQISEALFILAIPFLFNRIGVKKMLLIGMTAWPLATSMQTCGCCMLALFFMVCVTISFSLQGICIPKRNRMKGSRTRHRDCSLLSHMDLVCS
jgi:nucleoside transporter